MRNTPHGSTTPGVRFTDLIADTILAHGTPWTTAWMRRNRIPPFEVSVFLRSPTVRRAIRARAAYDMATGWAN